MASDLGFAVKTDREMILELEGRIARLEDRLAAFERKDPQFKRTDTPQFGPQTS